MMTHRNRSSDSFLCDALKNATCQEAYELAEKNGYQYLDVRTPEEFGESHPEGAMNVPVMFKGAMGMSPNPDFIAQVESKFPDKDAALVVGCLSGKRSEMAVNQLMDAKYTNVVNVTGGFMAWQGAGLPCKSA